MDLTKSIISIRESQLFKGVLILLIVLGHNGILMGKAPGLETNTLNNYLYHFHVYLFLILPFLYDARPFALSQIKKNFIRLYKPYTLLFVLLLLVDAVLYGGVPNAKLLVGAYVTGNEPIIKEAINASFPWFLPTMFSFLILRDWSNNRKCVFLFLFSIIIFAGARLYGAFTLYDINWFVGIGVSAAYYFVAVLGRWLCMQLHTKDLYGVLSILITVLTSISFFVFRNSYNGYWLYNLNAWLIMPLSIFTSLYYMVRIMHDSLVTKCLIYFGKHSLAIYMVHVFVYNALQSVVQYIGMPFNIYVGLLLYLVTLLVTIVIILLLKTVKVYKVIF